MRIESSADQLTQGGLIGSEITAGQMENPIRGTIEEIHYHCRVILDDGSELFTDRCLVIKDCYGKKHIVPD